MISTLSKQGGRRYPQGRSTSGPAQALSLRNPGLSSGITPLRILYVTGSADTTIFTKGSADTTIFTTGSSE